jgi:hypothetical protein
MMARQDGALVSWWRYFLIFMGVSFNKVKAVHELSAADEAALEERRRALRALARDPSVRDLLAAARNRPAAHVNQEVWRKLRDEDPFVAGFRNAGFAAASERELGGRGAEIYLSGPAGEKIAFTAKPRLFSHFDQNAHRFPMAGKEYTEVHLRVPFDPDSEVKAVELGVPVLADDGEALGSLVAMVPYAGLRR